MSAKTKTDKRRKRTPAEVKALVSAWKKLKGRGAKAAFLREKGIPTSTMYHYAADAK